MDKKNSIFSFLYCNRVKVSKGSTPILNLSLVFCILALLTAPWLVVIGAVAALVLGYKFGYERDAAAFSGDFDAMVKTVTGNVRSVVDNVSEKPAEVREDSDDSSADAE